MRRKYQIWEPQDSFVRLISAHEASLLRHLDMLFHQYRVDLHAVSQLDSGDTLLFVLQVFSDPLVVPIFVELP